MIFKEYKIPETQKEKFALAVKLAKDFKEKYVVMRESPRIKTKKNLPIKNGVKKIAEFITAVGPETMLVFFRYMRTSAVVELTNMPEIINTEMMQRAMDCYKDKKSIIHKITGAKEIRDDGEIITWKNKVWKEEAKDGH